MSFLLLNQYEKAFYPVRTALYVSTIRPTTLFVPSGYIPKMVSYATRSRKDIRYFSLLSKQDGRCAGCSRHHTEFDKRFALDHSHKTGQIRGLLCMNCNTVLGKVYDSSDNLRRLADYLDSSSK